MASKEIEDKGIAPKQDGFDDSIFKQDASKSGSQKKKTKESRKKGMDFMEYAKDNGISINLQYEDIKAAKKPFVPNEKRTDFKQERKEYNYDKPQPKVTPQPLAQVQKEDKGEQIKTREGIEVEKVRERKPYRKRDDKKEVQVGGLETEKVKEKGIEYEYQRHNQPYLDDYQANHNYNKKKDYNRRDNYQQREQGYYNEGNYSTDKRDNYNDYGGYGDYDNYNEYDSSYQVQNDNKRKDRYDYNDQYYENRRNQGGNDYYEKGNDYYYDDNYNYKDYNSNYPSGSRKQQRSNKVIEKELEDIQKPPPQEPPKETPKPEQKPQQQHQKDKLNEDKEKITSNKFDKPIQRGEQKHISAEPQMFDYQTMMRMNYYANVPQMNAHPYAPQISFPIRDEDIHELLEYYFSQKNLNRDLFIREAMDEQGWVSAEYISTFNKMKAMKVTPEKIESIIIKIGSDIVEKCRDKEERIMLRPKSFEMVKSTLKPIAQIKEDKEKHAAKMQLQKEMNQQMPYSMGTMPYYAPQQPGYYPMMNMNMYMQQPRPPFVANPNQVQYNQYYQKNQ